MQEKSVLSQLFPQPTGKNAYEDFVRAAELLKNSPLWAEAQQKNTLSSRRRALSDLPVRQARALIDAAMLKPLSSPIREMTLSTTFPEFTGFRDCARLLGAEMHVLFSEGRTAAALVSFSQGLRLGSAPKSIVLIGGLVGIAIDAILLARIKIHLEQLTPRDCDRVQATLREHVEADRGNAEKALAAEMRFIESLIPLLEKNPVEALRELLPDDEETQRELRTRAEALRSQPGEQKRILSAFLDNAREHQRRAQVYLADPSQLPKEPKLPEGSPESALVNLVTPAYPRAVEKFIQDRIQCQLLYCHAAIRKYRWEWEKLPDSLETLKLAEWSLDPYTRQPFRYEKKGESYELFSVGPVGEEGKRASVHLPWRKD
ncbi:MAG: hypothetical protein NTX57_04035 [Armatimonadetes bacterium]|nr:hypothetical protein [Armatimonadota bacterium]